MTLRAIKKFVTNNGDWTVGNNPYFEITEEAFREFGNEPIPNKNAASHIFVKAPVGSIVELYRSDREERASYVVGETGWISHALDKSASWWTYREPGEAPWRINVNGAPVVDGVGYRLRRGIGLLFGLPISTFVVVGDVPDEEFYRGMSEIERDWK